jgi:glucosylceramidase
MKSILSIALLLILLLTQLVFAETKAKVQWICSTSELPWQRKAALTLTTTTEAADSVIELYPNKTLQTIDGFGGCFNELGWEALQIISKGERDTILNNLFNPKQGYQFNICRMPIGANDYAVDWYSHNETPNDYKMTQFSIERDKKRLIPYIKEAQKINPQLKIWASPWCPPAWMKTNNHYACRPADVNDLPVSGAGREMHTQFRMEEKVLNAYALYFAKFIDAYKKEGIDIYAVHVQNEPNSCQNFPSCIWTPADLAIFIGSYLGPRFKQDNVDAEIWLGTIERPQIERIDTILTDPRAKKYIKGIGFQWAGKGAIPDVHRTYPHLTLMQTETECGNGSNDWLAAEYTFSLIKHYFNHGANAYMYWNMILDETGKSQWGWKQNSMISIDRTTKMITYNPEFYLMKHLGYFIKPGAKKLNSSNPSADLLAFQNPDGPIIILAANKTETEKKPALKIGKKVLILPLPARSFNTFVFKK